MISLLVWALSTLGGSLGRAAKRRITAVSLWTASLHPSLQHPPWCMKSGKPHCLMHKKEINYCHSVNKAECQNTLFESRYISLIRAHKKWAKFEETGLESLPMRSFTSHSPGLCWARILIHNFESRNWPISPNRREKFPFLSLSHKSLLPLSIGSTESQLILDIKERQSAKYVSENQNYINGHQYQ